MKQITMATLIIIIAITAAFFFQSGCGIDQDDDQTTPSPIPTDTPEPTATPEPTDTPEPTETPVPTTEVGTVWIHPANITVDMSEDENFTLEVYVNSGVQKLAAYGIDVTYNTTVVNVNESIENSGVKAGPDGFISAVNIIEPGKLVISGFDVSGTGPGPALHILIIYFKAIDTGNSVIGLTVNNLTDEKTVTIGTPTGVGGNVDVIAR